MRTRVLSAALLSVVVILLLIAGCGGGDQSGGGGSQGGGEQGGEQGGGEQGGGEQDGQQGGGGDAAGRPQVKIALGSIESVEPETREVVLEPQFEAQGESQRTFNVRKNAEIRVNDQEAELSDIQTGQSAQVEYVTKNDKNRAVVVEIVGGG